jgi:hypothetical protein
VTVKTLLIASLLIASVTLTGCARTDAPAPAPQPTRTATVSDAVATLVEAAALNDTDFFRSRMTSPATDAQAQAMIAQVSKAAMSDTYRERRVDVTSNSARLDYHDNERNCFFQVALVRDDSGWRVRGIRPCW